MSAIEASELTAIGARIERLVLAPAEVRDTVGWLARPLLRAIGWSPTLATTELRALLAALEHTSAAEAITLLARATRELEANVSRTERACVVHGRPPMGHATWLFRVFEVLRHAMDAREPEARRAIAHGDPILLLAPPDERGAGALVRADLLLEVARDEGELLGRRRALLEAARRMLLDASAALALPHDQVSARVACIASAIEEIDRLEACGVDPRRGLLHQARAALRRGEDERARACLVAVDAVARRRGDVRLATLSARALDASGGDPLARDAGRARASVARSAEQTFGVPLLERVRDGLAGGRAAAVEAQSGASEKRRRVLERVEAYLDERAEAELLSAALSVDGLFDVGGASTPVRVVEEERRRELVRHPAAELALVPAQRIEDLRDALVTEPRAILFQLAEGTLLARRYLDEEVRRHTRSRISTELRIYVADGSTSMLGPRARMRDAILLAELATLIGRLRQPDRFLSPVLEMRFFDRALGPIERVSTVDEALLAIARIFATPRMGGTHIQRALLGSFEQVRERMASDPTLAGAQIVLITDGLAPVSAEAVRAAREAAGELALAQARPRNRGVCERGARAGGAVPPQKKVPIRVSVIALGVENPALRALAAEQRARGERVFYHFVDDAELERIAAGDLERRLVLHVPDAAVAGERLRELVDEMESLARGQHEARRTKLEGLSALDEERLHELRAAAAELSLGLDDLFADGARARIEASERDERALGARFSRWFPERPASSAPDPLPRTPAMDRVDLARILLASTAEVIEQVGGRPAERKAEAITILERLLVEHGLPPWTYAALLREHGALLEPHLRALRAAVRGR